MSEEATDSTKRELELEKLPDRMEETTLDGNGLAALIREANADSGAGKNESFENALASIKSALQNKSLSLSTLLGCEELLPVLISGLKTDSSKVRLVVLFIVALIFKDGTDSQQKMVIGSGIIPVLISLLSSEDEVVCEKALQTLRSITANYASNSSLDYFRNSDIIPALIKLGERTEKTEWLKDMAWINSYFCKRRGINEDKPVGKVGKAEPWMLPSLPVVQKLLQLSLILLKGCGDKVPSEVTGHIGLVVDSIAQVDGSFEVILSSGIVPLMADALGDSEEGVCFAAAFAVEGILHAAKLDWQTLQFFEALQGSSGMKELWRNVFEVEGSKLTTSSKENCIVAVNNFLYKVRMALMGELGPAVTDAVIQSGLVHTLVKLLEKKAPSDPQFMALVLLENMMREMEEKNAELFLEMGLVPLLLELLTSTSECTGFVAIGCLSHLIKAKDTVRDEIVSRDGLQIMIRMLAKEHKDVRVVGCLLVCFDEILEQVPRLPLEQFDGLPEALKLVWGNMPEFLRKKGPMKGEDIASRLFSCFLWITKYGKSGIDLIRTSGIFEVLIGGLSSGMVVAQLCAMAMIVDASLIKQENREELMKLGVLDCFPVLFRSAEDEMIIQLVLICLKVFVDGKLSADQTKAILGMKSLVEAELLRDLRITSRPASMLLSRMGEMEK